MSHHDLFGSVYFLRYNFIIIACVHAKLICHVFAVRREAGCHFSWLAMAFHTSSWHCTVGSSSIVLSIIIGLLSFVQSCGDFPTDPGGASYPPLAHPHAVSTVSTIDRMAKVCNSLTLPWWPTRLS